MLLEESWCLSFLRLKAAVKGLIHLLFASKLILSSYLQISFKFDWIWSFIRKSLWSYSVQSKLMGESVSQGISKHISLSPFHFLSIRVIIYVRELCPSSVHFAPAPHNFCTLFHGGWTWVFQHSWLKLKNVLTDQKMDSVIHQINHYPANKTSKFCKISESFKILN